VLFAQLSVEVGASGGDIVNLFLEVAVVKLLLDVFVTLPSLVGLWPLFEDVFVFR